MVAENRLLRAAEVMAAGPVSGMVRTMGPSGGVR